METRHGTRASGEQPKQTKNNNQRTDGGGQEVRVAGVERRAEFADEARVREFGRQWGERAIERLVDVDVDACTVE